VGTRSVGRRDDDAWDRAAGGARAVYAAPVSDAVHDPRLHVTQRAILAAIAANVGLAAAKTVGWLVTGSASMLAEALHSLGDTANQGLLLIGRARSRRRESRHHPFGYGAERFFWAFLVSVLLLVGGAFAAIYKGVRSVLDPTPIENVPWALVILGTALCLDGASLLVAMRSSTRKVSEGWLAYIRRTKRPEVPVILLEDSTSVTGVLLALLALGLTVWTGNPVFDGIGSVAIGLLLAAMALLLARETWSLLMGEAAAPETEATVRAAILEDPAVLELVYLRTLHLGPDELFVEVKAAMDPDMTVRDVALAIDRIEARVRARVPLARIISIEPDIPRADDPDRPRYGLPP
jgi:cation diffusion facilitator family transporter